MLSFIFSCHFVVVVVDARGNAKAKANANANADANANVNARWWGVFKCKRYVEVEVKVHIAVAFFGCKCKQLSRPHNIPQPESQPKCRW